jgi:hypothetical protein
MFLLQIVYSLIGNPDIIYIITNVVFYSLLGLVRYLSVGSPLPDDEGVVVLHVAAHVLESERKLFDAALNLVQPGNNILVGAVPATPEMIKTIRTFIARWLRLLDHILNSSGFFPDIL